MRNTNSYTAGMLEMRANHVRRIFVHESKSHDRNNKSEFRFDQTIYFLPLKMSNYNNDSSMRFIYIIFIFRRSSKRSKRTQTNALFRSVFPRLFFSYSRVQTIKKKKLIKSVQPLSSDIPMLPTDRISFLLSIQDTSKEIEKIYSEIDLKKKMRSYKNKTKITLFYTNIMNTTRKTFSSQGPCSEIVCYFIDEDDDTAVDPENRIISRGHNTRVL